MVWRYLGNDLYRRHDGLLRSRTDLLSLLEAVSQESDCVIQPLLENHDQVADLSTGALAAARIVTGRTPGGDVHCIAAAFKMPWRGRITNTNGLSRAIDLESGKIGRAWSYRPVCPGYDEHPDTRARISGRTRYRLYAQHITCFPAMPSSAGTWH